MEKRNGSDNEDRARGVIAISLKAGCMTEEEGWAIYREGLEGIVGSISDLVGIYPIRRGRWRTSHVMKWVW